MGDWALRDIGRAKTKIYLGKTRYGDIENKYNYQEFPLDSMKQDEGAQDLQLYPAERWSSHFKSYSPLWESIDQIGGYKLKINQNPSAPQQTLMYGVLAQESTIPGYTTDYYPDNTLYIETDVSGPGTSTPATPSVEEQSFLPDIEDSTEGIPAVQISAAVIREEPFIPSSIDDLAPDATIYEQILQSPNGIKLHNIWNMTQSYRSTNMMYIRSWGPSWTTSQYAGATAEQTGSMGDMKIKVNANKGSLMLYRMAPMNYDIGLDSNYPWVFPYVDELGKPKHGLMLSEQLRDGGLFNNEYRVAGGKSKGLYNIGFKIMIDVSSEAQRGAFSGTGGVAPSINIQWGWGSNPEASFTPESTGSFASSFCVSLAHNKAPLLTYHDGERIVNVTIVDKPSDFSASGQLELTVEYLGTAMLVKTINGQRLISGKTGVDGSGLKGVYTKNPNISIFFAGCTAIFNFMPVYYNSWSPASDIRLNPDNIVVTDSNHTPTQLGFDPSNPISGFAKMMSVSSFNTYASPEDQADVFNAMYNSVLEAFDEQTYTPLDLIYAELGEASKFIPESGWPQCILDSRNISTEKGGENVLVPIAQVFSSGSGITTNFGRNENLPILAEVDPMSSMSIIWQVRTSCTTPIIFGFKTKDANYSDFPADKEKDISEYVTSWNINWKSEMDYKILRAESEINLLNPPGYLIDVLSKNIMYIRIADSGYREYSNAVEGNIKDYIYREGNVYLGITTGTSLKTGPGGDVTFTVSCIDPIKLLEDYRIETNLKFDGLSYFTAFSILMQASDYANQFLAEDGINDRKIVGGWKQAWRKDGDRGPSTIFNTATRRPITWDCMNSAYLWGSMFFGYQPMQAKSFEVQSGTQLMDALKNIIDSMHNPSALPLFFYRPSDNVFVLQVRDGLTSAEESAGITSGKRRAKLKSEFESEEELKYWLPILCVGNSDAYEMRSDLANICSHFTVLGTDRATGLSIKATAINPKWRILDNYSLDATGAIVDGDVSSDYKYDSSGNIAGMVEHTASISGAYGHIGYKRRAFKDTGNFIADMPSAYGYAMSRMWWLMRPEITINGLTVYGIIDYLDEGLLNVNLSGLPYLKCLINNSSISYDANEGTIISKVGAYIFPPWSM